jgi:hypothetical protein
MSETVHHFTDSELRAAIEAYVKPLEEKAFAAGVRAAQDAVLSQIKLEALVKTARDGGVLSTEERHALAFAVGNAVGKSPVDLAKRANELQLQARAEGKELSNVQAVQAAYSEAGVPWK